MIGMQNDNQQTSNLSGETATNDFFFMSNALLISPWASDVAVAVSARTLECGTIALKLANLRKAGLKSDFPQVKIQWASSTTMWLICKMKNLSWSRKAF